MSNIAKLKKKAAEFEQKRQFDKALAVYVELLSEIADDADHDVSVYNRAGDLALRQGNVGDAISYYEKAVDLYADAGFLNNAIALCNKILRTAPGRTSVYYKLGRISARKGFTSDAKQNFLEYADRMKRVGDLDEAFRALKEFADLCPDQDDVRLMLAEQLERQDRTSEAIDQLQQVHEKYEADGRRSDAEEVLRRMRGMDPTVQPRSATERTATKSGELVFLDLSHEATPRRVPLPPGLSLLSSAPDAENGKKTPAEAAPTKDVSPVRSWGMTPTPQTPIAALTPQSLEEVVPEPVGYGSEIVEDSIDAQSLPSPTPASSEPPIEEEQAEEDEDGELSAQEELLDSAPAALSSDESEQSVSSTPHAMPATPAPPIAAIDVDVDVDVDAAGRDEPPVERRTSLEVLAELESPFERSKTPMASTLNFDGLEIDIPADDAAELDSGSPPPRISAPVERQFERFELTLDGSNGADGSTSRATPRRAMWSEPADGEGLRPLSDDGPDSARLLSESLSRDPNDHALRRRLGEALVERGNRSDGLCELDTAMLGYSKASDLETASDVADEILRIEPDSILHHQRRVEFAFRLNDVGRLTEAYLELGDALVRTGDTEKARVIYRRVLDLSPDDARARSALRAFVPPVRRPVAGTPRASASHARTRTDGASIVEPTPVSSDFVDLGDWLREEEPVKSTRMVVAERPPSGDPDADFADMLRHFKRGIAENVAEEDHESHYDLGIAYKEMGLLDEAVAEFQKALRGVERRVRTYEALGQCFVEQGRFTVAATILQRALVEGSAGDEQLIGVLYLLGTAYEALERHRDAVACFERIYAVDIAFRDVVERLQMLTRAAG